MTDRAPALVSAAASQRAEARADRNWALADRLKGEIEAAGWRVVDQGPDYRLEQLPVDVELGGEIRYGRSDAVPSRLDAPATGVATVVLVATPNPAESRRAVDFLIAKMPDGVDVVVVADGLPDRALEGVRASDLAAQAAGPTFELVRTSAALGRAAALNIGIRRARGAVVVAIDPRVIPTGDVIGPLVAALEDQTVAIAGAVGLASADLRHFRAMAAPTHGPIDAAAISATLLAFRRADAAERGPLDEGFRSPAYLDAWWSLVLRDEGEGARPRRALAIPGLPLDVAQALASALPPDAADRLAKRNAYRLLDRFRARLDLAVPDSPPGA